MAVLLVFSIVSLAVFCQSKPLTRFARSLIQGSRPPTATFEHFTGEGVKVTVALASAMICEENNYSKCTSVGKSSKCGQLRGKI